MFLSIIFFSFIDDLFGDDEDDGSSTPAKKEKGDYYGPFASAGAVNRTLSQLQRVFLLRNCSDSMFESRTRPCLQYQIKRCSGPCVGKISEKDYAVSVKDAERFLSGKSITIAHKSFFFQRLNQGGLKHQSVSLIYLSATSINAIMFLLGGIKFLFLIIIAEFFIALYLDKKVAIKYK